MVARRLVVPANPQTTNQDAVRGFLAAAAVAFQALTPSEKADWDAWAVINQSKILGQPVVRPAISEYCGVNVVRQIAGEAISDVAPTAKADFAISGITSVTNTGPGTSVDVVFTHNATVLTDKGVLVRTTLALPSQLVSPKQSDFRLIEGASGPASYTALGTSPQTIVFNGAWNYPAVGAFIGIQIVPVSPQFTTGVPFGDVVEVQ
jgi:hypothetical protein